MAFPLPAVAPVTPFCAMVQLKVVPDILLVKGREKLEPEQIVCAFGVAGLITGRGFTVIVTVIGVPEQLFADGVIL